MIIPFGMIAFGVLAGVNFLIVGLKAKNPWRRALAIPAAVLFTTGWVSFMSTAAATTGGLNWLPNSFEWPVGWSDSYVKTSDGLYAVPHVPAGRVQLYDSNWKFLRGWQVVAGGGVFRVEPGKDGQVEVFTARGSRHHVFDRNGTLLATGGYARVGPDSFGGQSPTVSIPTPWWGWTLTSPGIAWGAGLVGMLLCACVAGEKYQQMQEKRKQKIAARSAAS
jgi:hypothetical protein